MNLKLVLIGVLVILLAGCATTPSPAAQNIMDADHSMVSSCKFIGSVSGSSGWGNLAASTGISNAKNEARAQAAKLGATHIVWLSVMGGYSPNVSGNAYKCR